MEHAGKQRAEIFALHGAAGSKRKRAHGAAVEAAVERDQFVALGVVTRELNGGFGTFGAGVAEVNALGFLARRDRRETLREFDEVRIVEVRAGHVNQFAGLLLNRFDDVGMAMAGGTDSDAAAKSRKVLPSTSSIMAPRPVLATSG